MKSTTYNHPTSIPKAIPEPTFQILSILNKHSSGVLLDDFKENESLAYHPDIVKWLNNMYQQGFVMRGTDSTTKKTKYSLDKRGRETIFSVDAGETLVKPFASKAKKKPTSKKIASAKKTTKNVPANIPNNANIPNKQQETEELSPEQRQIEMYLSDHGHKFMESAQNVIEENAIYRATLIQIYNLIGNKLNLK